jgi:DNA-binding response OmpR family regulator
MISALGQEMKVLEALNKGAKNYIIKPFKPNDIIKNINSVIESQQYIQYKKLVKETNYAECS